MRWQVQGGLTHDPRQPHAHRLCGARDNTPTPSLASRTGAAGGCLARTRAPTQRIMLTHHVLSWHGVQAKLSRDNWFVACKLVALAQTSGTVAIEPLHDGDQSPLPPRPPFPALPCHSPATATPRMVTSLGPHRPSFLVSRGLPQSSPSPTSTSTLTSPRWYVALDPPPSLRNTTTH